MCRAVAGQLGARWESDTGESFQSQDDFTKLTAVFKKIENLDALENLEELWLGKNKITILEVRSQMHGLIYSFESEFLFSGTGLAAKVEDPVYTVEPDHEARGVGQPDGPRRIIHKS